MSELVMVISAITMLIASIGGAAAGFSKLTPFVNALNKMFADRHKRAMEAKSIATIESPISATENMETLLKSKPSFLTSGWTDLAIVFSSYIVLALQFFASDRISVMNIAIVALSVTSILQVFISRWAVMLLNCIIRATDALFVIADLLNKPNQQ